MIFPALERNGTLNSISPITRAKLALPSAELERHAGHAPADARFSILLPTWNNLPYLRLCVESLRRHSHFRHQIILHINDGSDGTEDWARAEGLDYTRSAENLGVCYALNAARSLVRTDYVCYMNDDMYACPGWDLALWEEIARIGHPRFFLSATMLEPRPTHSLPVIAPRMYGSSVETFDEAGLLAEFAEPVRPDWSGASRPPNVVHRDLWDLVGGYSTEFSPGAYSDPDFSMKLFMAGVRHFRGVSRSRVYHFVSKTNGRIPMNKGRKQFLHKWGIGSSTFENHVLRLGQPFGGDLPETPDTLAYRLEKIRNRLQRMG
jgi:GT2 family glycosyltransferase